MRRRWQTLILALAACALAGCATSYRPDGVLLGGYKDVRLGDRSYEVWCDRGPFLSGPRAWSFALRRAAEVAVANHFAGFAITNDLSPMRRVHMRNRDSYDEMKFPHLVIQLLDPAELTQERDVGLMPYDAGRILHGDLSALRPAKPPPRIEPIARGFAMR